MCNLKQMNDQNIKYHNALVDLNREMAVNEQDYAQLIEIIEQRGHGDQSVCVFLLKLSLLNLMVILVFQFQARDFQRDIPAVGIAETWRRTR